MLQSPVILIDIIWLAVLAASTAERANYLELLSKKASASGLSKMPSAQKSMMIGIS